VILYGVNGTIPESAILSLNIGTTAPEEIGYILKKSFGIIVRTGLHCAPLIHRALGSSPKGTVRVSPSSFTTIPEAEAFCSAIEQISKMDKQAA
jgi:selenocysteine lyase/cysteine desulfurase